VGERGLERRHEIDDRLQAVLEVAGQAPVSEAERSADTIEQAIERHQRFAADTAEPHGPAMAACDAVEVVAVKDEQQTAVGRPMDR